MSWAPVNDSQTTDWQSKLPARVAVNSVDTPGDSALGSLAIGGGIEFTYTPNQPLWLPVQDDNVPGWVPVTA